MIPFGLGLVSLACLAAPMPAREELPTSLRLFLDVQNTWLDATYLRTNLTWVDWVRDREAATIHLIVTSQSNGGGGQRWNLRFIGLGPFKGVEDELTFSAPAMSTDDELRKGLANQITKGLARYSARLGNSHRQVMTMQPLKAGKDQTQPEKDPWNAWVFRLGGNTYMNGESQTSSSSFSGSFNASRITEEELTRVSASGYWSRNRYDLSDQVLRSSSKSTYGSAVMAYSLSEHWTWGFSGRANRSSTGNLSSSYRVAPALEFNVWKYSQFSQRQLTFLYQVGSSRNRYVEETVYGKTQEHLVDTSLTASLDLNQPWGTISASASASAYVHDWTKNSLSFYGSLSVRVTKGLSINMYGSWSRVRNQMSLPKGEATDEEVLLRLKELKTSHRYSTSVGLSYTFGSIFNNAVNSRFRMF